MSDSTQPPHQDLAQAQARIEIREQISFMLSLTAAITQNPNPNPNPNPNQEPNISPQIASITSGSLTATIIQGPLDLHFLSEKSGPSPASKASIDAMPRISVTESENNNNNNDCVICLDEFEIGGEAREMPCKHCFHSGCIEKWLKIHGSCPVCRFVMPVEEEEEEKSDGEGRRRVNVSLWFMGRDGGGGGSGDSNSGSSQETQVDDGSETQDMES